MLHLLPVFFVLSALIVYTCAAIGYRDWNLFR